MKKFNYIFRVGILLTAFAFSTQAQIITTIAGDSSSGYFGDGIPAIDAALYQPIGVAVDGAGNVYIGDRNNNRIRKVNTSGIITTIAGTGVAGYNGDNIEATAAEINQPYGIAVDGSGTVYFADVLRVRKINTSGIITTIAGDSTLGYNGDNIAATAAKLNGPAGVAIDADGNVYITDALNNRVRKVNTLGIITSIGGTGASIDSGDNAPATAAGISGPYGITLDAGGNIYIGEQGGYRVRKINTSGIISTIAGNDTAGFSGDGGQATAAKLNGPLGVAIDISGNIFISDFRNARIRKVNASGIITTYAGTGVSGFSGDGGLALDAEFNTPVDLAFDEGDNLFIVDGGNNRIRRITSTVSVNTLNTTAEKLIVYPNPSQGPFTINLSGVVDEQVQVIITNVMGEQIKEFTINTNKPLNVELDERVGVYFINATTPTSVYNAKLVITQ